MKKALEILSRIFRPSGFKIGILITIISVVTASKYYELTANPLFHQETGVIAILEQIHQRSVDFRMKARGHKAPSESVALAVVDEKALEKIGRWPFSRDKIAHIVEELMKYGAKVVGFDAIFSEPDISGAMTALERVRQSPLASQELKATLDEEIRIANKDMVMAETIKKWGDRLVMGAYWDNHFDNYYPYQELCGEIAEQMESEFPHMDLDERPTLVIDDTLSELPEKFKEATQMALKAVEEEEREKLDQEKVQDPSERSRRTREAKILYCMQWLTPKDRFMEAHQAAWPEIQAATKNLAATPFDAFKENLQHSTLPNQVFRSGRWWLNIPDWAKVTKYNGYFNAFQDADGTIRHTNLVVRYGGKYWPSMAMRTVMIARNQSLKLTLGPDAKSGGLQKGITEFALLDADTAETAATVPADSQGRIAINYAGPRYMFPHMSVAELFSDKDTMTITQQGAGENNEKVVNKKDFIKDRIFLFGATAIGIFDLRVTPFDENYPGLETHANIVENLLQNNFLIRPQTEEPSMMITLIVLGLLLSFAIGKLEAVQGLLVTLVSLVTIYFVDKLFLFEKGKVVAIMFPNLQVAANYVILTFYKYLTEERKKKAIRGTFEKYVSPSVVNEILKNPTNIELGGKKQRMSVMFSDVRGFTTISEKLDPQVLSSVLNAYLTPMTRLVFECKGTLDKYMGDAIMSFFGAPIFYEDHAKWACRCALQMMAKLDEIQKDFAQRGLPMIDIGIGINTGDMSVGNMGSDIVRSYTVMGDAVNLGSRLEGINKQYGTHIIISEFTYEDVKNDFVCREVDWVRVKGKKLPVKIYELISEKPLPEKQATSIQHFSVGFQHYHQQMWDQAVAEFNKALELNPQDETSKLYIERCEDYKIEPPGTDWDGVFEMKTK